MALVRRLLKLVAFVAFAMLLLASGWIAGRLGIGRVVDPASLTEAERQFADRMRNVTMVGTFTVWGREQRTPRTDRYEIDSVEKIGDDQWRFNAKMDCCGLAGSTVPIAVPMRWVGDTPVIMMTDAGLPGMGTYTVRVFFYGDHYAGTWQNPKVGGFMSGKIEKKTP
jgi:hypothetical protein